MKSPDATRQTITYDTHPDQYKHWRLSFDGQVATLHLDSQQPVGPRQVEAPLPRWVAAPLTHRLRQLGILDVLAERVLQGAHSAPPKSSRCPVARWRSRSSSASSRRTAAGARRFQHD